MDPRKMRLSKQEQLIEDHIHEYIPVKGAEFEVISQAIARRKKDTVLNIRISSYDLESIKNKAKKFGIKYQTFISEVLHKVAHA